MLYVHLYRELLIGRTVARGIVGVGVGGEYSACSTSTLEAANDKIRLQ